MYSTTPSAKSRWLDMGRRQRHLDTVRDGWHSPRISIVATNGDNKDQLYKFPAINEVDPWRSSYSSGIKIYHKFVPVTSGPPTTEPPKGVHIISIWEAAALGWVGGMLMLAVFVFLMRAVKRCLTKKFIDSTRSQPGQARTVDVYTIRRPRADNGDAEHDAVGQDELPSDVDLPPSYYDCAREVNIVSGDTKPPATREEDLPSYSDCYVPVNHKGRLAPIYVYCTTRGTRTNRSANVKVVEVNETVPDVVTQPKQSNEASDTVAHSGEVDTSNGDIKVDAETKKPDGNVTV